MGAGDSPRTRVVLRLIAVERSLRGLLLLAAGTYLLFHLSTDFGNLAERIIRSIDIDPRQHFLQRIVVRLHSLHAQQLRIAGIFALGYGGLELVEGVGLWLDQLWAEIPDPDRHLTVYPVRALRTCGSPQPVEGRRDPRQRADRLLPRTRAAAKTCNRA